jgi:hypothetical protein
LAQCFAAVSLALELVSTTGIVSSFELEIKGKNLIFEAPAQ